MIDGCWTYEWCDTVDLYDARQQLTAHLVGHGITPATAGDVNLVISELATNAFEHAAACSFSVTVNITDADIDVHTVHDCTDNAIATMPLTTKMPPAHESRGRGFAIVAAIAASHRSRVLDGSRHDSVTIAR